ncbi:hypothetical protein [Xylanimonas sp. McL0601]|uniref:hypothetical protein n=1 Tax=Xylanimonas sp. McL0601 TaxID=3414739 RepID=UPI003CED8F39
MTGLTMVGTGGGLCEGDACALPTPAPAATLAGVRYTVRVTSLGDRWRADVEGLEDASVEVVEWSQLDAAVRALVGDLTGAWIDDVELDWADA